MLIDILYLAHGRPEFTQASIEALVNNTDWRKVRGVWVFTDGDPDPLYCWRYFARVSACTETRLPYGGPVAIMNHFLARRGCAAIFAKIDNDVIVPPGWLDPCLAAMEAHPELGLLGIEPPASRTPAPWRQGPAIAIPEYWANGKKAYAPCDAIGGIGLMRRSAFAGRPPMQPYGPHGVGGFTNWQTENADVCKGWIVPPLNLFLLDRLPVEPWASLSQRYLAEGIQRPWTNYAPEASALWDWWLAP